MSMKEEKCVFCHSTIQPDVAREYDDEGGACCIPCFLTESDTGE